MTGWWNERTRREQRLILVMLAMLGAVAAWLLIVRPLGDAEAHARVRYAIALDRLARARSEAAAIERVQANPPARLGAPVETFVASAAAEAGFTGSRVVAAGPGRAGITIEAARPQAFFGWVEAMQARGLVVERLRAAANGDRTLAIEATLRARGR